MAAVIIAQDVKFHYDGDEAETLHGLTFQVEQGEFLAVLGHNGSGKSTLAKLLNALYVPNSGKIIVCGFDTAEKGNEFEIRQRAGMVFQNPDNQLVATIVEEDIAFGLENLGILPEEIRQRVDDSLETVRMKQFAQSAPHMLSGGQKQRIAIAGIVAMRPQIIIFDEPTAMLDPIGRREVMQTIRYLNEKMGVTIVLITHFMDEAAQAGRIMVINEGRIALEGTPREVFSQVETLKSIGLDVPAATELAQRLHARGYPVDIRIIQVQELVEGICRLL